MSHPDVFEHYILSYEVCWSCASTIPVYMWRSSSWSQVEPPEPRPASVLLRSTSVVKHGYWGNVCKVCNANQGDWYLYSEPDGPFFGFERWAYDEMHLSLDDFIAQFAGFYSTWFGNELVRCVMLRSDCCWYMHPFVGADFDGFERLTDCLKWVAEHLRDLDR